MCAQDKENMKKKKHTHNNPAFAVVIIGQCKRHDVSTDANI